MIPSIKSDLRRDRVAGVIEPGSAGNLRFLSAHSSTATLELARHVEVAI